MRSESWLMEQVSLLPRAVQQQWSLPPGCRSPDVCCTTARATQTCCALAKNLLSSWILAGLRFQKVCRDGLQWVSSSVLNPGFQKIQRFSASTLGLTILVPRSYLGRCHDLVGRFYISHFSESDKQNGYCWSIMTGQTGQTEHRQNSLG